MKIREGNERDARAVAHLHAAGISEGFLSSLGPRFLAGLYRCIARDESSILYVAVDDHGRVRGMIAGSEDTGALYRRFARREGIVAAITSVPRLLRRSRSVWETWRYGAGSADDLPPAELLSVAVDRDARRAGVGRRLFDALLEEFERREIAAVKVVVGGRNDDMVGLCHRAGFRDTTTISVHGTVPSKVLVWSPRSR